MNPLFDANPHDADALMNLLRGQTPEQGGSGTVMRMPQIESDSVLDSTLEKYGKKFLRAIGADDPTQVMGVGGAMEVPGGSGGPVGKALGKLLNPKPRYYQQALDALDAVYERIPATERDSVQYLAKTPSGDPALTFQVTDRDGRMRLRTMEAHQPRQGHGTRAMQHLTDIADAQQMGLELTASPFRGNPATRMTDDQLKAWYSRHGFVPEPGYDPSLGYMIRNPKK